jgi:hypothetical protein
MKSLMVGLGVLALVATACIPLMIAKTAAQSSGPYAGMQARAIKALSAEQIADLKAGRGLSLALAAELNGYPGPRHVLELVEQLGLTDQQRADVQRLFDDMTAEVVPLGELTAQLTRYRSRRPYHLLDLRLRQSQRRHGESPLGLASTIRCLP